MSLSPHPDRLARTLAQRQQLLAEADRGPWQTPRPGSADARVDLCLLWHAVDKALEERGTPAAHAWLEGLDTADLRAGTIQDCTARGLMARLEEALSLCKPAAVSTAESGASPSDADADADADADHDGEGDFVPAKELRRKREILIASGGARIRFSRRHGILLVDRKRGIHEENCIQFADQSDQGCLDGFRALPGERPRLFSPAFLRPALLVQGKQEDRLVLTGSLGRGAAGFPCQLTLVGRKQESGIRLWIRIDNRHRDHRLRIRFLGLPEQGYVSHLGTPDFEQVLHRGRSFLAATLVRACGRLRVGEDFVTTPGAQILHAVTHFFGLGL